MGSLTVATLSNKKSQKRPLEGTLCLRARRQITAQLYLKSTEFRSHDFSTKSQLLHVFDKCAAQWLLRMLSEFFFIQVCAQKKRKILLLMV